jgi:hypothetical protein
VALRRRRNCVAPATRRYEARDREEALNWIKFNRDWMKNLKFK